MAKTLNPLLRHLLAAAGLVLAQAGAHGQNLHDPTRPPALAAPDNAVAGASAGPQLQSVLISREPGGRHLAVIDGDTVRLGQMYKGARVARIAASQVELVRGKERQVLKLQPDEESGGIVKTSVRPK